MMKRIRVAGWLMAICGLWEFGDIVAPLVPGFGKVPAYLWNHSVVGLILVIAGVWVALTRNAQAARTLSWIAAVAGLWLMIAAFVLGNPAKNIGLWNDVAVGAVVLILGAWAALAAPRTVR